MIEDHEKFLEAEAEIQHMKKAVIVRIADTGKESLGHFFLFSGIDLIFKCVMLEPPWKNNVVGISCIPAGNYFLTPRKPEDSPKFKYPHFIVEGVPNRDYILIHRGNFNSKTRGCFLPGRAFVDLNDDGEPDVCDSEATLNMLVAFITEKIPLTIVNG